LIDVQVAGKTGFTRWEAPMLPNCFVAGNERILRQLLRIDAAGLVAEELDEELHRRGSWLTAQERRTQAGTRLKCIGKTGRFHISTHVRLGIPDSSPGCDDQLAMDRASAIVKHVKLQEWWTREVAHGPVGGAPSYDLAPEDAGRVVAEIARAESSARRVLKQHWDAVEKLAESLPRRRTGRMSARQVIRLIGGLLPSATIRWQGR
jgi:hypothetical protein